ncbi:efflux RND transporter periplasmic adaptor subunit [Thalassospira sp.]|uniref:efflux RND transporter periplasmic adaptor subunit n=1 Tax=Thalassospira sp. TaxID=1912094 RepID=UPI002732780F|nr:HlyD family efflux transporter periplasmic adaptor subunit [Thalassospira sp.]MDP2699739.1 HlyD family efflux transporter periplasmic adaptor subunit [Thalassospira sp.]
MAGLPRPSASTVLLGIERSLRHAPDLTAWRFTAVSEPRRLIPYQQAVLVERSGTHRLRVAAVSNVASIDRNAPYILYVERMLSALDKAGGLTKATGLSPANIPENLVPEWSEFLPAHLFWQPLEAMDGTALGGLVLMRAEPWQDAEPVLLDQLADAMGHAWQALRKTRRNTPKKPVIKRGMVAGGAVALLAALFVPVPQSVIAPADVIPRDALPVSAPIRGVIHDIHVRPNAEVRQGDVLFSFEDAELRANHQVAMRAVDEAGAELRRVSQQAFGDAKGRAEIALMQARLAMREEQAAYSNYQLSQVQVIAPQDGIAIFSDPNRWRGRPVSVGEQVMLVARPQNAEIAIFIPVSDAINLRPGADVRLFLDVDPLRSFPAVLELSSYQPMESAEGVLAYRAVARFEDQENPPRIGLKGSARISGDAVPLALFLFRRPLSALRQMIGM